MAHNAACFLKITQNALAICCMTLFSGCVPMMEHYYEPSAPGSIVSKHDCGGRAGVPSNLRIVRSNVTVLLSTDYISSSEISVVIQFELQKNDRVFVHWKEMRAIVSNSETIPVEVEHGYAYNSPIAAAQVRSVSASVTDDLSGKDFNTYEIDTMIKSKLPDEFAFILPSMVINGIEYPVTRITFKKRFGVWISPINC